jgi:hypothetical protein
MRVASFQYGSSSSSSKGQQQTFKPISVRPSFVVVPFPRCCFRIRASSICEASIGDRDGSKSVGRPKGGASRLRHWFVGVGVVVATSDPIPPSFLLLRNVQQQWERSSVSLNTFQRVTSCGIEQVMEARPFGIEVRIEDWTDGHGRPCRASSDLPIPHDSGFSH